jgi:type III pantothenate kinase
MIEGLVLRLKAEVGRPVKVIATGGLATLFEKHTDVFDAIEPDLTIQGLAILFERTHMKPAVDRPVHSMRASGPAPE